MSGLNPNRLCTATATQRDGVAVLALMMLATAGRAQWVSAPSPPSLPLLLATDVTPAYTVASPDQWSRHLSYAAGYK